MFLLYFYCSVCCLVFGLLFFFFKQKTAYEMRISDWSSDVCSSDLCAIVGLAVLAFPWPGRSASSPPAATTLTVKFSPPSGTVVTTANPAIQDRKSVV